ncbi:peptidoglycan DD-metalloendopeptidase family protein [Phototrophicus methaneseepsis]|uniref:Peptidoglycan DD-metalloendopeptidase family protein n=1 Tax=Phototrophicus methaneseepsis TaxID=2710758 RepID=A0A7S8ID79_9CHLR|nr:peptidoglycan DD-metalloendopeptidase family protein [Phototrophicus methaneseepsis]QPC81089.1 peptidoglycan DD-metalloendopeptidase family protein [Phototrophicus methaneseepsis]
MSSSASVPKPSNPGPAQTAIANTKSVYANIRVGPGTQYRDIGDLRDNSLCVYYPQTRTSDSWYWVEYSGVSGWVSGSVVDFEAVVGGPPSGHTPTPYDGAIAIWHWKGDGVAERTIEELATNVKRLAPNVSQIWVKTSDGPYWQGRFDSSSMAVNGTSDLTRWADTLSRFGLQLHAWCVPTGVDIESEARIIAQTCNHPGVKSMILDVEPYTGFWQGGAEAVRPFMMRVRQLVTNARFHIGMSMDPRPWHFSSIYPNEWYPFIDSLHPQCYWQTFRTTPEYTLQQMMDTWASYGRPIYSALQGDADLEGQREAHTLATKRHGNLGLSWWRYGVISQFGAVNTPIEVNPVEDPDEDNDYFVDEVVVVPDGPGFRRGTYTGKSELSSYDGTWGWKVLYKTTEVNISKVWAEWKTTLPESGRYEIATFVPARHATTTRARFKIHGIRGTTTEVVVDINQYQNRDRWVTLGIFDLVKGQTNAGKVFLNDVTGEPDKEIAFDAVRFRRILTVPSGNEGNTGTVGDGPDVINGVNVADGYESPVGTNVERASTQVWPSGWLDASPYAQLYFVGTPSEAYHTGADLNFGRPYEDLGMPVYATASGVVVYQASLRPWGNVTIIRHDPLKQPTGKVYYSRYGHMQNVSVAVGARVRRGQQIGEIGNGEGRYVPHLHFDIVGTTILVSSPGDWPGTDLARLKKHYLDPKLFIQQNRPG